MFEYKDPKTGDLSEECDEKIVPIFQTHAKFKPINKMVKVRLTKLASKQEVPFSSLAYRTDDTETDVNPHPNLLTMYNMNCFQTDLFSKSKSLPSNSKRSFPKDKDTESELMIPSLKPALRHSLFQRRANLAIPEKELSHTDDNVIRGERFESDSRGLLRASQERGFEDSRLSVNRLSQFIQSNNDSMKNNQSRNTRSRNLSSQDYLASNDTNALVSSSKLLSDTIGISKSILKPPRYQGESRSPGKAKVVRFSRLRTVVYFNMLHNDAKNRVSEINHDTN